jgi:hypothetical protein
VDPGGYGADWYLYGYDWGLPATGEWWPDPYQAWPGSEWSRTQAATTGGGQAASTQAAEAGGPAADEAGSGVTAYWHGNPGY